MIGTKEPRGSCTSAPKPVGTFRQWGSCPILQRRGRRREPLCMVAKGSSQEACLTGKNNPSARNTFSATDLASPVQTILANPSSPSNYCYLNSLVQALLWIYQARPSARVTQNLETCTLCCVHCLLQVLRCSFIEQSLASAFGDLAQPTTTARCCRATRASPKTHEISCPRGHMGSPNPAGAPLSDTSERHPGATHHAALSAQQNTARAGGAVGIRPRHWSNLRCFRGAYLSLHPAAQISGQHGR